MRASIYYFTGMGNSLFVARELASRLGAELISIKSVAQSERIDISFVYTKQGGKWRCHWHAIHI